MIYKYYQANYAIQTLRDGTIKLTPPNEFNDPYEFRTALGSLELKDFDRIYNTKEKLDDLYDRVKLWESRLPRKNFNRRIKKDNLKGKILYDDLENHVYPGLNKFQETISKYLYVACFSKDPSNMLMWSHYADNHKGIILGFDFDDEYLINDNIFKDVIYSNSVAVLDIEHLKIKISITKSLDWKYEKEKRLIVPKSHLHLLNKKNNISGINIKKSSIKEIILGSRINSKTIAEIKNIVNKKEFSHIQVLRSALKIREYKIVNMNITNEFRSKVFT